MPATLRDIAARANTSVSTVSRVLNGKDERISEETRQLVLEAAKELKYRPNPLARGLRLKKTNSIGLVVPDISNPFFAHVTRSIQALAHRHGYTLVVCNTDEDLETEREHIDLLRRQRVDGMIVMPIGLEFGHLEKLQRSGMPLVLLDRYDDALNAHAVVLNNHRGGYLATELLIDHGHRRIGISQGLDGTSTNAERVRGYQDALRDHGIPADERLVVGFDYREQSGYESTKALLCLEGRPTAIFATSDLIALGVIRALLEEGLQIPRDVSIVSFDDVDFAPVLVAPLTTVAQPREDMGEAAVQLLVEQIEAGAGADKKARQVVFQPRLIERGSVAPGLRRGSSLTG